MDGQNYKIYDNDESAEIIEECKLFVKQKFANLGYNTIFYLQSNFVLGNCIETAVKKIKQLIAYYNKNGLLKENFDGRFNLKIFQNITDKLQYMDTRHKECIWGYQLYARDRVKYDAIANTILPDDVKQKYLHYYISNTDFYKTQIFTDDFIMNNWNSLYNNMNFISYANISEQILTKILEVDEDVSYWCLRNIFSNRKLSKEFIIKHIEKMKEYSWIKNNEHINQAELIDNGIEVSFKMRGVA